MAARAITLFLWVFWVPNPIHPSFLRSDHITWAPHFPTAGEGEAGASGGPISPDLLPHSHRHKIKPPSPGIRRIPKQGKVVRDYQITIKLNIKLFHFLRQHEILTS